MKTIDDEIKFLQNGVPYADTKTQLDEQAKLAKQAISQLIQEAIPEKQIQHKLSCFKNQFERDDQDRIVCTCDRNGYNRAIKEITERLKEKGLLVDGKEDRDGASSTHDNRAN